MRLQLLHVDDALKEQSRFLNHCRGLQAQETDIGAAARVRLWGKDNALLQAQRQIAQAFGKQNGPVVTFMGSGDFHHVSALLIGILAERTDEPLTVIHFDNHPDWVHFRGGMHCGSWVNRALALPQVERVITLGVCSRDLCWPQFKGANLQAANDEKIVLLPWQSPSVRFSANDIAAMNQDALCQRIQKLITTRNVYITIDKDVLPETNAITNWDQGGMPLTTLMAVLRFILDRHHAIGVDVCGDYSPAQYEGTWREVMLKKIEARIDQPRTARSDAAQVNEASNLALLECIREAAL